MEKRIFLAIVISIAVLIGWSFVAPKLFPELARKPEPPKASATDTTATTRPVTTTGGAVPASGTVSGDNSAAEAATAPQITAAVRAPVSAAARQQVVVDMPEYVAVLSNRGAQLVSFKLKNYKQKGVDALVDLVQVRAASRTDFPFTIIPDKRRADLLRLNSALYSVKDVTDPKGVRLVEFRYSDGQVTATKTFRFTPQPYLFDFNVSIHPPVPYRIAVGPGIRTLTQEELETQAITTGNAVVQADGKFKVHQREKVPSFKILPSIEYIGIEDNYFLTALRPREGREGSLQNVSFYDPKTKTRRLDLYAEVNATSGGVVAGDAFFGPKETKVLDAYNMSEALQLGWFDAIARLFLIALLWINKYTLNWGFAIIVLTILIKIALYPLQHKQNVSMKKMQRVQPKVEAIKAKYKKSRTDAEQRNRMNVEMMELYKKEGINPMAGCLPLLLQLPILWGFYNLLSRAIELRGAPWILWIRDLSEKDPTYILPILMTLTMFLQTYLMPATGDPAQRRMFLIMPFIFGFMFKDFPSGLVLYWLVQNVLTIIQQLIMNKWWKDHPAEVQNG
jgi:YidC/Oxa1 family membrane protein insertase